jgi:SLA1 Homology Domain 1 (SHD1) protein
MVEPPSPPAQPPADDMPEEPAPAPPAEDMPEEPTPAPKSGDVDDLFKDADDKSPPDKSAPAEEPETPKTDKSDDADDLFKESDNKDKKAADARRADDESLARLRSEIEDLFGEPADEAATNSMRLWSDNTGKFQIYARLITVGKDHVRLLKDTGKYTTVPFNRLSHSDLAFVRQHDTTVIAQK